MNAYLLSDLVRIDGATGLILETGEAPEKASSLGLIAPRGGFSSFQAIIENADKENLSVKAKADPRTSKLSFSKRGFTKRAISSRRTALFP